MSVLISGANGFIANHIVKQLLEQDYKVIGTVRSQAKADHMLKLFNNKNLSIEIVPDLLHADAFDHVFEKHAKDIEIVLHTASPVVFDVKDNIKDIVTPAISGTKGIFSSIKKYGGKTVKRVVMTSSVAAIHTHITETDRKTPITEDDWCPLSDDDAKSNPAAAYFVSKTRAEKYARDFYKENKANGSISFELTTIHPAFVFGPQAFDADVKPTLNFSADIVNKTLHMTADDKPATSVVGGFIDVRDVAKAHILAFQRENTIGKRLALSNGVFSEISIINILNKNFKVLNGKIPKSGAQDKFTEDHLIYHYDFSKTDKILDFKYISLDKSIVDTATQILHAEKKI